MEPVFDLRPSWKGWLRKYLLSLTPLIALVLGQIAVRTVMPGADTAMLLLILIIAILAVAYVLRGKEAAISVLLTLGLTFLGIAIRWSEFRHAALNEPGLIPEYLSENLTVAAALASLLTLAGSEALRRSIHYTVTAREVVISGGLWRKQIQSIPYHMVGRVLVEQSLVGRLLGYGTVIIVSPAAWGDELYARFMGIGGAGRGVVGGVGYARILQEVSRDPLKVLYGIPRPMEVFNYIQSRIAVPYEHYELGAEYFRRELGRQGSG